MPLPKKPNGAESSAEHNEQPSRQFKGGLTESNANSSASSLPQEIPTPDNLATTPIISDSGQDQLIPSPPLPFDVPTGVDDDPLEPSGLDPFGDVEPTQLAQMMQGATVDIDDDFRGVVAVVENCISLETAMIQSGIAVLNSCATTGMFQLMLDPENFLAQYQAIISANQDHNVINYCSMLGAIAAFAEDALLTADLTDDERSAIEAVRQTYQAGIDAAEPGFVCNGTSFYNADTNSLDIPCENCDDVGEIPEPATPVTEPCEADQKIELCGMEQLTDELKRLADCCEGGEEVKNGSLIAWYNCDTGESQFLPPGETPEGDYWEEAGAWQETLDKLIECICPKPEGEEETDEPKPGEVVKLMFEILGVSPSNCELPPYVALDPNFLGDMGKAMAALVAGGVSLNIVGLFPIIGDRVPKPSLGIIVVLTFMALAILIAFKVWSLTDCKNREFVTASVSKTLYTWFERLLPGSFEVQIKRCTNFIQLNCPSGIPSIQETHQAYLADQISLKIWRCWVRANDVDDKYASTVLKANRSKLRPDELVILRNREEISEQTYYDRMRELGFLDQGDSEEIWSISKQLPGQQDLIRFMVRDVEDKGIVQKFGLMDGFGKKYQGDVKRWTENQNIPVEVMEANWKAHWRYPGFHQLSEAMHRFRNEPQGSGIRTTKEDVKTALLADDVPEFWVDRMIAMSFNPLTRIDARRAFNIGAIDKKELKKSYTDLGYSDDSADTLVKFSAELRRRSYLKHAAIKSFAEGEITILDYTEWMESDGADNEAIDDGIERARLIQRTDKIKACSNAIKKRFFMGEMDRDETYRELRKLEIDDDIATVKVEQWVCEKSSRGRMASLTQLFQWFDNGTMTVEEYARRLRNLGWDQTEITRIVRTSAERIDAKIKKVELARIRKEQTEADKARKEAAKQLKQAEAAGRKSRTANDKARKSRLRRDKVLAQASDKMSAKMLVEFPIVFAEIRSLFNSLSQTGIAHQDSIAAAIKEIAETPETLDIQMLANGVSEILSPVASFGS